MPGSQPGNTIERPSALRCPRQPKPPGLVTWPHFVLCLTGTWEATHCTGRFLDSFPSGTHRADQIIGTALAWTPLLRFRVGFLRLVTVRKAQVAPVYRIDVTRALVGQYQAGARARLTIWLWPYLPSYGMAMVGSRVWGRIVISTPRSTSEA
ncbi:hypothetical protein BO70DRAFT_103226 [Aspergillus heteromorphus CBS 117.55]|uniref:Uncharacterized protein n=1 Tax=Aspergillus heteromorphus CBS 117.55 TaxID=1448321 RepID=A0A317VL95_9EURO|nr:uncharacterized protein BO70DRAFT_103226 [Aspergillus heteromorphus CBS 117.55]PWY75164.1 hypothetical protein BO70DRAFT_103226 [Aspergillus heteromorphus CBS 117.55]